MLRSLQHDCRRRLGGRRSNGEECFRLISGAIFTSKSNGDLVRSTALSRGQRKTYASALLGCLVNKKRSATILPTPKRKPRDWGARNTATHRVSNLRTGPGVLSRFSSSTRLLQSYSSTAASVSFLWDR